MKIDYYAFALFISGLICLIAIIFKVLFANVKRQYKLLDEKESKLLQLYQAVESIMEEFNDQAKAATDEIREYESRVSAIAASLASQPPVPTRKEPMLLERLPRAERVSAGRFRAAGDVLTRAEKMADNDAQKKPAAPANSDNGAVFQRYFEETAMQLSQPEEAAPAIQSRSEAVLALAEKGKTDAQIASDLGITQNEVKLIIGLVGTSQKNN